MKIFGTQKVEHVEDQEWKRTTQLIAAGPEEKKDALSLRRTTQPQRKEQKKDEPKTVLCRVDP